MMKYCLVLLMFLSFFNPTRQVENQLIYHPIVSEHSESLIDEVASVALRHQIQDVYFKTGDHTRLNGWYIPAKTHHPTILYAHGNWGNMADQQEVMSAFAQEGDGFFMFDYRGYGKSQGSPSEGGLYQDIRAASRFLNNHYGITPKQQIAVGNSLGGAVVIDAATHIHFSGVMVCSTFTSITAMASYLRQTFQLGVLNHLPIDALIQQRFDSISKIPKIKSPLIVAHGDEDNYVPYQMSWTLYDGATSPYKKHIRITGANHQNAFSLGIKQLVSAINQLNNTHTQ